MNYPKLESIEQFGSHLLTTQDLDPLYVALVKANISKAQLRRWLFAYWCCYNAGAASWLSEYSAGAYWEMMRLMAENRDCPIVGRWPRGHERRHFRGKKAVDAVEAYAMRFPDPEMISLHFENPLGGSSYLSLRRKVMELPQFGPWIAFKVADMLERVMNVPIDFTNADVMMFKQPFESALMVYEDWAQKGKMPAMRMTDIKLSTYDEKERVQKVAQALLKHFGEWTAPPITEHIGDKPRNVNIQEVETILCKWKSHLSGSYPLGNDIRELRHGLEAWLAASPIAVRLYEAAPAE